MIKRYVVAREGFLKNTYRTVGETVYMLPRAATYLVLAGQLRDPDLVAAPAPVAVEPAQVEAPVVEVSEPEVQHDEPAADVH